MDNEKREALEIKIAWLEDYVKQVNEVVLGQAAQLNRLTVGQEQLKNQLEELMDQLPGPESRKPPHY